MHSDLMGDKGLEPSSPKNVTNNYKDSANSASPQPTGGAVGAPDGARGNQIDPALAELVRRWPTLPPAIKAGVLAMIQATKEDSEGRS